MLLLTTAYYFRRLYTIFDSYILLIALPDSDFARIQDFLAISHTYGLKTRLEFGIDLLALIHFFCSSIVSSIVFNVPL